MRVLLVTKSAANPASRYRAGPVIDRLRARGDEVKIYREPGLVQQLGLVLDARQADLVFVQRKLLTPWICWLLARLGPPLVFDFDDAIFLRTSGGVSPTRQRRFRSVVSRASLVFAGNTYLAEAVRSASNTQVVVLPTAVDVMRYPGIAEPPAEPTLVWIGSRSTSRYLFREKEMLEALGQRIPGLQLKIIADFELQLANVHVINVPWSEESEVLELTRAHLGIAPMSDDPWTRGKCALKVIQYMAAGLPVVSSNAGANTEVIVNGETGYLADTTEDWINSISALLGDAGRRQVMGKAARKRAEHVYSQDAVIIDAMAAIDRLVEANGVN